MELNSVKVVDATKPLCITITDKDVQRGSTKDPGGCAAARACLHDTPATEARVHIGRTYLKIGNKWLRFKTPQALRSEIIAFDRGGTFSPGDYVLRPPAPADRLRSGRQMGSSKSQTRSTKLKVARIKHHQVSGVRPRGANR